MLRKNVSFRGKEQLRRLVLSAMLLSVGIILPFFTGQIPSVGSMLLPMHLPVFVCGLVCGWQYGGAVGLILPLLRSALFGMPPLYPNALSMAAELAVYGFLVGLLYALWRRRGIPAVYGALIPAMLVGRGIWGLTQLLLLGLKDLPFSGHAFLAGAFLNAIPGIILQLVLIPAIMTGLHYTGMHRFGSKEGQI